MPTPDPKAPDPDAARTVLTEDPPGARPYLPGSVSKHPQDPRSPGQSEPGDMGAFEGGTEAEPQREGPAGNGGTGYRGG
ncbi:hypothetical protein MKK88_14640 [Methylobacterium sp. E-005]|uniref:hypothetical protein n=1 Tax=Methylobacterium sp. E-005 TaxID=2836549 RepID=UPI001FBA74D7|nr:hypothetical protein [Methylobacterium sp. E-005]MCJ2087213.1 hypothetical protein [Methylobacterium sp. E-005]